MKYAIILISLLFELACTVHSQSSEHGITPEEASLYIAAIETWEAKFPNLNRNPSLIGGGVVVNDKYLIAANSVRNNYDALVGRNLEWKRLEQKVVEQSRAEKSISFSIVYDFNGMTDRRVLEWDSGHFRLK